MRAADRDLLTGLFGALGHPLASRCAERMLAVPRFGAFLIQYQTKIHKKARTLESPTSWQDLWLELWTAARLLADRRFTVAYETFAAQKVRGPDLTATFRANTVCQIEIKHVRAELTAAKWAEVVCSKLGQLPPGAINVLLVGTAATVAESCPAETALRELGQATQRGDDALFQRSGLAGARDYARQIVRLSGVLRVANWDLATTATTSLWRHPAARHPLPDDLARALVA
jgi:hypothetical protein